MNSMSASDAAPLPRLGEVFFDVRGSSRSMRLSWYSDTGVAVFSIWQGGTCTGTFRLPIEDLPRMTEALQRGPRGAGVPATDVPSLTGLPGGRRGHSGDTSAAPFAEYATGQHIAPVTGEFRRPELEERATDPFGSGGYRAPSYREDPLTSPSFRDEARSAGYRDSIAPYGEDPLGSGSYRSASYRDRDRADQSYQDQAYPDRGYPGDDAGYPPGYQNDDAGGYQDRRYADDPFQSNYPDEPRGGSHPYGQPGPEPRGRRGRP